MPETILIVVMRRFGWRNIPCKSIDQSFSALLFLIYPELKTSCFCPPYFTGKYCLTCLIQHIALCLKTMCLS